MYHFLYETVNLQDGTTYRGMHSSKTLDDGYLGSGLLLQRAIAKYGKHQFERRIHQMFDTRDELRAAECVFVNEEYLQTNTYNLTVGGNVPPSQLGSTQTAYTIEKRVQHMRGIPRTADVKRKLSEALSGVPKSDSARRNMSAGKINMPAHKKAEWKRKLSEANVGKVLSDDVKRKIGLVTAGTYWWNDGQVNKRSKQTPGEGWVRGRL